ncbi:hypothetical protein GIB67_028604, partial [Kingdonia uniflora]
ELSFNLFGGRNPFDNHFLNPPSMFGPSLFGGAPNQAPISGFIPRSSGPVIQEILSDESDGKGGKEEKKDNPRKHLRLGREVHVDDQAEERRKKHVQLRNAYNRLDRPTPQTQSFNFQSSIVTYGGPNGAYYTSSATRQAGSDGVSTSVILQGHSFTMKLNSDGKVDSMQTLHNLEEGGECELRLFCLVSNNIVVIYQLTLEESKEADTTTGKASHRVSRGIHDKRYTMQLSQIKDSEYDEFILAVL